MAVPVEDREVRSEKVPNPLKCNNSAAVWKQKSFFIFLKHLPHDYRPATEEVFTNKFVKRHTHTHHTSLSIFGNQKGGVTGALFACDGPLIKRSDKQFLQLALSFFSATTFAAAAIMLHSLLNATWQSIWYHAYHEIPRLRTNQKRSVVVHKSVNQSKRRRQITFSSLTDEMIDDLYVFILSWDLIFREKHGI